MRNFAAIMCCCFASLSMTGCNNFPSDESGPGRRYPDFQVSHPRGRLITDPYFWARMQFSNGDVMIEGANIDEYPICYATADINGAPGDELFIRDDVFGTKYHRVLIFEKESGGYRFLGWFDAGKVVIAPNGNIVAAPASGTTGKLSKYFYLKIEDQPGQLAPALIIRPVKCPEGAPENNNEYYSQLIKNGKILKWTEY